MLRKATYWISGLCPCALLIILTRGAESFWTSCFNFGSSILSMHTSTTLIDSTPQQHSHDSNEHDVFHDRRLLCTLGCVKCQCVQNRDLTPPVHSFRATRSFSRNPSRFSEHRPRLSHESPSALRPRSRRPSDSSPIPQREVDPKSLPDTSSGLISKSFSHTHSRCLTNEGSLSLSVWRRGVVRYW